MTNTQLLDPTVDEMREFLDKELESMIDAQEERYVYEFDRESAIYWYANFYHGGQNTNLYSALSTSKFKPGMGCNGPEKDSMEQLAYELLEGEYGKIDEEEDEEIVTNDINF